MHLFLILLAIALFPAELFAKTAVTVYCDDSYSPYSYIEGEEPRGLYVEILRKIFARMPDYDLKIEPVPWKRGLNNIREGRGFALIPPYYNEERNRFGIFSDPIFEENIVVVSKPALAGSIKKWPEDVFGKNVGINSGFYVGGDSFFEAARLKKINLEEAKTNYMNLRKLQLGRIDYFINDKYSILWEIKKMKFQGEIPLDFRVETAYAVNNVKAYLLVTRKGKYSFREDFLKKFNQALKEFRAGGELKLLVEDFVK